MKEEWINVMMVCPNQEPEVCRLLNSLKIMQTVVSGDIETFPLDSLAPSPNLGAIAIMNEEGKITPGIKPNRKVYHDGEVFDIFYGTFFICSANEDGDFTSITPLQETYYRELFSLERN